MTVDARAFLELCIGQGADTYRFSLSTSSIQAIAGHDRGDQGREDWATIGTPGSWAPEWHHV